MWVEKIINYKNNTLSNLNLRFDLHFAILTIDILKDVFQFKINKEKNLSIIKTKKEINTEQFFYWWQITRYEEINKKELELVQSFEKINKSIESLQKTQLDDSLTDDDKQAKIIEIKNEN